MATNDLNTEQIILKAAEDEFLEKGYGNAKTVSIAERADVSHSMLHYYFRTKEQLFQKIFKEKVEEVAQMFGDVFEQNKPFEEIIRLFVETQFNYIASNPNLPRFILNELLLNKDNRDFAVNKLFPQIFPIYCSLEKKLNDEIEKKRVRPILIHDLLFNIISINVAIFFALPIIEKNSTLNTDNFLNERRESNVQFILNSLII